MSHHFKRFQPNYTMKINYDARNSVYLFSNWSTISSRKENSPEKNEDKAGNHSFLL